MRNSTLLLALALAPAAMAQERMNATFEDVTAQYVKNADFAAGTLADSDIDYSTTFEAPASWTIEANDQSMSGLVSYGSEVNLQYKYSFFGTHYNLIAATPVQGPDGSNGQAAALAVLGTETFGTNTNYYSQPVTLPAGNYQFTYVYYNGNASSNSAKKNYFGFIAADGTEYLGSELTFAAGEWRSETIAFTLNEQTEGQLTLGIEMGGFFGGGTSVNGAKIPGLFIDRIELSYAPFGKLLNPSFELGTTAFWDVTPGTNDTGARSLQDDTYACADMDGLFTFNAWDGEGEQKEISVSQTLTGLQKGYYVLSARLASNSQSQQDVILYAGSQENAANYDYQSFEARAQSHLVALPPIVVDEGDTLKLGAKSKGWFKADDFQLVRFNSLWQASLYYRSILPTLVLTDQAASSHRSHRANVSVKRNFNKGWNSVTLPFAVIPEDFGGDVILATFAGTEYDEASNAYVLHLEEADYVEANTPFFVYLPEAIEGIQLSDQLVEAIATTTVADTMSGAFSLESIYAPAEAGTFAQGDYTLQGEVLQELSPSDVMPGLRAYLVRQDAALAIDLRLGDDIDTAVEGIQANTKADATAYDLAGRRARKEQKGIIILHGRKMAND